MDTLIPDTLAACMLPPMAYMFLPSLVLLNSTQTIAATTRAMITMYGIEYCPLPMKPEPILVKSGRRPPIGCDWFGSISKYREFSP
ncbi:hypothetical protein D3C86_1784070 [compost metagenome]